MMLIGSALAVCDTPWKPPKDKVPERALPWKQGEAAVPCPEPLVLEQEEGRCHSLSRYA